MRTNAPLFLIAGVILLADQASKLWVRTNLFPGQSVPAEWPVRLTHVTNSGAAFGLLPAQTTFFILVAAVVIVLILLYDRILPQSGPLLKISLGLQLGGAVGNLVDRVRYGYVVDFFDLQVWPVFNVADASIVVGVAILFYLLVFSEKTSARKHENPQAES
ncbi:MAG: signal peptidase II [Chloroflexota bacterium]|nr:MAG: signal peptidase II [Chloroflexota bacterium]